MEFTEFTFEWGNGKVEIYYGIGKNRQKVSRGNVTLQDSPNFRIVGQLYEVFDLYMANLSEVKGKDLTGKITLETNVPYFKKSKK